MQQHHYTAAELTSDADFPSHLTQQQARRLVLGHGMRCEDRADGGLSAFCICSGKDLGTVEEEHIFRPTADGLFRAAPILLWLGY